MTKKQIHTKKQAQIKRNTASKNLLSDQQNWLKYALLAGIVLITFIVLSPALKGNFVNWDDQGYVLNNTILAKPLGECAKYFFSNIFFTNYHPLTMMVYALEFHATSPIQGLPADPAIFHEVNIIIHLLNVMLVFWFIFLLSGKKIEVAVIVSLLFGIHPMHVESIAWISELKDCLYAFFFILGLICYYNYIKETKAGKDKIMLYLLSFLMFILSGISKPAAVTFTLMLPLIDFYAKRKFDKWVLIEKIPFLVISIILGIITIKAQSSGAIGKFELYTIFQRFMLASYSMLSYLYKVFLPIHLSALYPFSHLIGGHFPTIFYFTPFIALLVFTLVFWSYKYTRIIVFGFLFFLLNIVLVLQFMSVGISLISERYTYIPYIGLFFIIGTGFSWIYRNKRPDISKYESLAIVLFIGLFIAYGYLANAQSKVWNNCETLWNEVIKEFPNDPEAFGNRGLYLVDKGSTDVNPGQNDYDQAFKDFKFSITMRPNEPKIYADLGNIYGIRGKFDSALINYSKALALDTTDYNTYLNRGITLSNMQKFDSAFSDWEKVLRIHGPDVRLYQNRAFAYLNKGRFKESIQDYNSLAELGFRLDGNMYFFRACDYFQVGNYDAALLDFSKAIEMNPNNKEAYYNRSQTYNNMKNSKNALYDALKAQSLGYTIDPAYIEKLKKQL